jgi:hypothetical protein
MKKIYVLVLFVFALMHANAQGWQVYDCNVLPPDFDPAFGTANTGGAAPTHNIIADPENPGNSLLEMIVDTAGSKWQWRHYYEGNPKRVTWVTRIKGVSDTLDRIMEIDMYNAGFRERLFLQTYTNGWRFRQADESGDLPGSTMDWHIYRVIKDTSTISLYIDEKPVPVAVVDTSTRVADESYFRFGDADANRSMGAYIDWMIWDTTGAYAPGEGEAVPDTLIQTVPDWQVYDCNVLPPDWDPPFGTTNTGGAAPTHNILEDLDNPGNSLLEMIVDTAGSKWQWRHYYEGNPQAVTWVTRIKGVSDTLDRIMEIDMYNAGFRERLFLQTYTQGWHLKQTDVSGDLDVGTMGWHIYRMTKIDSIVNFYVDEDPVPIATVTTPTVVGDENYFRFGDADANRSMGAYIDWMIWDTTGAYAPDRGTYVPDSLITDKSSSDASLADLETSLGVLDPAFHPDSMDYMLSIPVGTDSVVLTATASDTLNATVVGDGVFKVFPDTTDITVTSEDGLTKVYTVNIQESGTDASLSNLESTVGVLNPAFDPGITTYDLRVPGSTVSLTLTATTNDPNANAEGDGEVTTIPGTVVITVTAQFGNTQDYTVNIVLMSSDATLSSLSTNTGTLVPDFDPGITSYTLGVLPGTASIFILANANDPNADISGDGTFTNIPGTATITVTAEDATTQDYTIDVYIISGLNEAQTGLFSMYPNPAGDVLYIKLNSVNCNISVHNILGESIIERTTANEQLIRIDFSGLNSGLYLIKVSDGDKVVVKQIVRE